ncbi:MAG: flavodoxin-dependent (E)-4-hydroxy-3-methylbut-2-enyl-diphosphate synthase, partial [Planctomycetota bacterium]
MEPPKISRRDSQSVSVGDVVIGGGAPVSVQSMTNTPTADADATAGQVRKLADAGAELVRIAVPTREDSAALTEIVRRSPVPIIADVHFHFD